MGLFETVKVKANALAADAERAGKITAAQARTIVLQNDIRKAERELGHAAFSLIEDGALAHTGLDEAAARLRAAAAALREKEADIEALRGGAATPTAEESPSAEASPAAEADVVAGPAATEAAEAAEAAPAETVEPAAEPVAAKKAPAKGKPSAKKPAAKDKSK